MIWQLSQRFLRTCRGVNSAQRSCYGRKWWFFQSLNSDCWMTLYAWHHEYMSSTLWFNNDITHPSELIIAWVCVCANPSLHLVGHISDQRCLWAKLWLLQWQLLLCFKLLSELEAAKASRKALVGTKDEGPCGPELHQLACGTLCDLWTLWSSLKWPFPMG